MLTDSHCHLASHRFQADEVPVSSKTRAPQVSPPGHARHQPRRPARESNHRGKPDGPRLHRHPSHATSTTRRTTPPPASPDSPAIRASVRSARPASTIIIPRPTAGARNRSANASGISCAEHFELAAARGSTWSSTPATARATLRSKTRLLSIKTITNRCAPSSTASSGLGKTRSACSTSAGWFRSAASPPSRTPRCPRNRTPLSRRIVHGGNRRALSRARTAPRQTQRTRLRPPHRRMSRHPPPRDPRSTRHPHQRHRRRIFPFPIRTN
jgi:hypothetical protein